MTWNLGTLPADCTGIRIQRSTDGQIFTTYATLEGTEQTSFIDDGDSDPSTSGPGLPPGSRIFYRVRAIGGASGGTGYTPKKGGNTVMDPPQNVTATAYSATEILAQWIDVTTTETRFSLEVTESGGDTWVIPTIPANQTGTGSFIVSGLQPGVEYSFRMQAWGPGLESIWTLPTDPTAPDSGLTPPAPTFHGLTVDNPAAPQLLLVNFSVTGTPTEVAVELATDNGDFVEVYRAPPGVNPIMIPATEGTSYLVRMRSFKNGIPSAYSDLKDIHAAPLAPASFGVVESQPTTTLTLNWRIDRRKRRAMSCTSKSFLPVLSWRGSSCQRILRASL